jgi:hypothetical protein
MTAVHRIDLGDHRPGDCGRRQPLAVAVGNSERLEGAPGSDPLLQAMKYANRE